MNYLTCTDDSCEFVDEGESRTLMSSPIRYDRNGTPIGGGTNTVTKLCRCTAHDQRFQSKQTELEDAQGVERKWERIEAPKDASP